MSVYETNHKVVLLGSVATLRLVNLFERAYDAVVAWNAERQTAKLLSGLSDTQLADIGLRRENIAHVAGELARG